MDHPNLYHSASGCYIDTIKRLWLSATRIKRKINIIYTNTLLIPGSYPISILKTQCLLLLPEVQGWGAIHSISPYFVVQVGRENACIGVC